MSASVVASVVGIASGVNALTGGGITSMFGGGGSSGGSGGAAGQTSGTYDPYGQYRQGDAATLQGYMKDPSSAMAEPGYQQTLQQGMDATSRGMAASGQLQSGAEQTALQAVGQNTFGSYYQNKLATLMQLSGASQNPANAGMAQAQAAALNTRTGQSQQANFGQNLGGITSGLQGIYNSWGTSGNQQPGLGQMVGSGGGVVSDPSYGNLAQSSVMSNPWDPLII